MPELRKDPIIGRWVIIATDRAKRPSDFAREPATNNPGRFCPFCDGNEDKTPPEILGWRPNGAGPNQRGWSLRVVPNKFPALGIEGELSRQGEGLFDKMNGVGAHEIIIETPRHDLSLAQLPEKRVEDVLWAYRDRMLDLKKDKRFRYILIFKNHGEPAGASLEHTHSQLIALPVVPIYVREEVEGAKTYYNFKERCIFCDIIRQEAAAAVRVIEETDQFLALAPYAPRFPFETWILPKQHEASFENSQSQVFENLARVLKRLLQKLDRVLECPSYNYVLHTSPLTENAQEYYHWHLEVMPKLTKVAGFEWGSGFYINPTPPEESARFLREASLVEAEPQTASPQPQQPASP